MSGYYYARRKEQSDWWMVESTNKAPNDIQCAEIAEIIRTLGYPNSIGVTEDLSGRLRAEVRTRGLADSLNDIVSGIGANQLALAVSRLNVAHALTERWIEVVGDQRRQKIAKSNLETAKEKRWKYKAVYMDQCYPNAKTKTEAVRLFAQKLHFEFGEPAEKATEPAAWGRLKRAYGSRGKIPDPKKKRPTGHS